MSLVELVTDLFENHVAPYGTKDAVTLAVNEARSASHGILADDEKLREQGKRALGGVLTTKICALSSLKN